MDFQKKNHGEGGSEQVRFRPLLENELLDKSIEQFLVSSRFEQRGKLEQLGIEIGTFKEQKQLNIGSSPVPKFLDISIRITRKQIR